MGVTAGREVRGSLARLSLASGWLPVIALVVIALLVSDIPTAYRYLPLVASAILFGMPHGAVDYVALPRARTGRVTVREVGLVAVVYLLLGGLYLLAWFVAPLVAAAGFILLTWFHWGQGDLYVLTDLFETDHVDDTLQRVLTVLVRGGLPMVVPLVGFPERYRAVLGTFVEPFGGAAGEWWLFEPTGRLVVGAAFGTLTLVTLSRGYLRARNRRGWRLDARESLLLWVYFLVVPPVLAVGIYFCLWHSIRHIVRVLLLDTRSVAALADRQWLRAAGKFALEAALPTGLALGLVAALAVAVPGSIRTVAEATGLYLVAIAVLTLPHTAVVLLLDREQGVWSGGD